MSASFSSVVTGGFLFSSTLLVTSGYGTSEELLGVSVIDALVFRVMAAEILISQVTMLETTQS